MLPGTRLMRFARRWFPPTTVSSVFEPLVADWQRQWNDATPAQRRWINVRGFAAFATTAAMMTPRLALDPGAFRARPVVLAGSFWLVTSCLLTVPFATRTPPQHLWLLLPSSLTLMLPFAMLPAIDALRRDRQEPTPSDRRAALALVVTAVLGVVIGQGWITPAANQRWRNAAMSEINGRPSVAYRGLREMTTAELIAGDATNTRAIDATPRLRELSMRGVLAALPIVLAWLRWLSLNRARTRSWPAARSYILAAGAAALFMLAMGPGAMLEQALGAPGYGPVIGLSLFAITARSGIWWRRRAV
jgi:hypothetical protein